MGLPTTKEFNTNAFFSGGGGMFVEYNDVVKPIGLYSVIAMIFNEEVYSNVPLSLIKDWTVPSILEWYLNRRYINPLQQLDWNHQCSKEDADNLLKYVQKDSSIYKLAPMLNVGPMLNVYKQQYMSFPWFIYTEEHNPNVEKDLERSFGGVKYKYVYGDLKAAISNCDENYTYIFSDIEKVNKAADILIGTCSHILVATDYRYNYIDNFETMKYDLLEMAQRHPFLRIDRTSVINVESMAYAFELITNYNPANDIV